MSIAGTLRHNLALRSEEIEEILNVLSPRFGEAPDRGEHIAQVARSIAKYPPGKVPWKVRFDTEVAEAPSRLQLMTLSEAFRAAEEEVDWVVPDLLAAGEKAVIAGPPKSLKTWLALHLLRCTAVGEAVLGEEAWCVRDPQPVLLVQEEGSRQRWAQRLATVFEDAFTGVDAIPGRALGRGGPRGGVARPPA